MGYIYKVNTYGYKVDDGTDRVVPETDGVKLMKGFTIQLGRKRTDMEQMSMREHPISELTG